MNLLVFKKTTTKKQKQNNNRDTSTDTESTCHSELRKGETLKGNSDVTKLQAMALSPCFAA